MGAPERQQTTLSLSVMILKKQRQNLHLCFRQDHQDIRIIETKTVSSSIARHSSTLLRDSSAPVDVLGSSDIINGTLIALVLAFTASFLQGRRNRDDFAPSEISNTNVTSPFNEGDDNVLPKESTTFDADSWKEISQPESYVFYKQKLRERESKASSESSFGSERKWVLFALLALFVPIFSIEFFFALSRQVICGGDPMNQSDWSEFLCSPAMTNFQ